MSESEGCAECAALLAQREARAERVDAFLAECKEAGRSINPENVEFSWGWAEMLDPYGVDPVPPEYRCIGRVHFVRTPGSDIWVEFRDLSEPVRDRVWQRLRSGDLKEREFFFGEDDDLAAVAPLPPAEGAVTERLQAARQWISAGTISGT